MVEKNKIWHLIVLVYVLQLMIQLVFYGVGIYFFSSYFMESLMAQFIGGFIALIISVLLTFYIMKSGINRFNSKFFIARLTALYFIIGIVGFYFKGFSIASVAELILIVLSVFMIGKYFFKNYD